MKSQKLNDGQWRVTAPKGNYALLTKCNDGWEVSCWFKNGSLLYHGGIHNNRFDAKVEAERLLRRLDEINQSQYEADNDRLSNYE